MIARQPYGIPVDWWCLGNIIYEMLCSLPPFYEEDRNTLFKQIKDGNVAFDDKQGLDPRAKDIISRLLEVDPEKRLGSKGVEEIKSHPWFSDLDWNLLIKKKYESFFKPILEAREDVSYFD